MKSLRALLGSGGALMALACAGGVDTGDTGDSGLLVDSGETGESGDSGLLVDSGETGESGDTGGDTAPQLAEHCGTVSEAQTWAAADGPHYVTCDVKVREGGVLTVEAGAEVYFVSSAALTIGDSGRGGLVVEGTESAPVVFAPDPSTADSWGGVTISDEAADISLSNLTLRAAGTDRRPALEIQDVEVALEGLVIEGAADVGLELNKAARLAAGSAGITVSGAQIPIRLPAAALGELAGVTASGNAVDAVQVSEGSVSESLTWPALDVPYWVDDDIQVEGIADAPAVLTIEGGAELAFDGSRGLYVARSGGASGLLIEGGAASLVVLRPWEAETAGAWDGVGIYDAAVDGSVVIDGAEIRYGGDGLKGNLHLQSVAASLDNLTLSGSEEWGLYVDPASIDLPTLGDISYEDNASGDYNLEAEE
jgi:hypothetical protein